MRQWLVSEFLYFRDDPRDGFAWNTAQVFPGWTSAIAD
jgi:hypothetical protein